MNRIIREHYPVDKLPEDLQGGFEKSDKATVTVEVDAGVADLHGLWGSAAFSELLRRGRSVREINFDSVEEVDRYVRLLRE